MANIAGTNIASAITPFTTADTYATHYAINGKGGHRTVATIVERNNISIARRERLMTVAVDENSKTYKLINNPITTLTSDADWIEDSSGGDGITIINQTYSKFTERLILYRPLNNKVSDVLPISKKGDLNNISFYVKGILQAVTLINIYQNGLFIGTVSIGAIGKTTLTIPGVTANVDDLFTFAIIGGGLAGCSIVCNMKFNPPAIPLNIGDIGSNIAFTEKYTIQYPVANNITPYTSDVIPLTRNGNSIQFDFYVKNQPLSETIISIYKNGVAITNGDVKINTVGRTTLALIIDGAEDDAFTYVFTGNGLRKNTVVCVMKWGI